MTQAAISITGERELLHALNGLPTAVQRRIVKQVMRPAAKPVLAEAKRLAPVDSGALRDTMMVRLMKRSRMGYSGVVVMTGARKALAGMAAKASGKNKGQLSGRMKGIAEKLGANRQQAVLNSKWYYPAAVEFGGTTEKGRIVRPQPFMRPALEKKRAEALRIITDLLWRLIDKESAKLAAKGPVK